MTIDDIFLSHRSIFFTDVINKIEAPHSDKYFFLFLHHYDATVQSKRTIL